MRRIIVLVVAALLTVVATTPVLAAGPPERARLGPIYLDPSNFAGTCSFAVELQDTFASSTEFLFPVDRRGNQRLMYSGGYRSTLTNLEDDVSVDVSYFGHVTYLFRADGSIRVQGSGQALWWFTDPADAAMYGLTTGIYLVTGRVEAEMDENFITVEPAKIRGTVRDLCAELAG